MSEKIYLNEEETNIQEETEINPEQKEETISEKIHKNEEETYILFNYVLFFISLERVLLDAIQFKESSSGRSEGDKDSGLVRSAYLYGNLSPEENGNPKDNENQNSSASTNGKPSGDFYGNPSDNGSVNLNATGNGKPAGNEVGNTGGNGSGNIGGNGGGGGGGRGKGKKDENNETPEDRRKWYYLVDFASNQILVRPLFPEQLIDFLARQIWLNYLEFRDLPIKRREISEEEVDNNPPISKESLYYILPDPAKADILYNKMAVLGEGIARKITETPIPQLEELADPESLASMKLKMIDIIITKISVSDPEKVGLEKSPWSIKRKDQKRLNLIVQRIFNSKRQFWELCKKTLEIGINEALELEKKSTDVIVNPENIEDKWNREYDENEDDELN